MQKLTQALAFDDILIKPEFSNITSRKDVDPSVGFLGQPFKLGVISSNMDTVTGPAMAKAMAEYGAGACLHRFCSIEENVEMFKDSVITRTTYHGDIEIKPFVSIGIGEKELTRAYALAAEGAEVFVIDVAHGAAMHVVEQYKELRRLFRDNVRIVVGNFATGRSISDFNYHAGSNPDAYKSGVGGGSACTTRVVTGCGMPTFASVLDCARSGFDVIADGGIRNSGDLAKTFAAGAKAVFLGRLLAGAEESPGQLVDGIGAPIKQIGDLYDTGWVEDGERILTSIVPNKYKKYRGSASLESYGVQGKVSDWRAPEGESYLIPYTGPVRNTLQQLESGLRSAMSYVGASDLEELRERAEFVEITNAGARENGAHGKTS